MIDGIAVSFIFVSLCNVCRNNFNDHSLLLVCNVSVNCSSGLCHMTHVLSDFSDRHSCYGECYDTLMNVGFKYCRLYL